MAARPQLVVGIAITLAAFHSADAVDIDGVQPAALDQPRINLSLSRTAGGVALHTGRESGPATRPDRVHNGGVDDILGNLTDDAGGSTCNIEAFLDTGASGVMISTNTADALGIRRLTIGDCLPGGDGLSPATKVVFTDVGVGGGDKFNVGEPLFVSLSPFAGGEVPSDTAGYPIHTVAPIRPQIGPLSSGIMDMLTGGLDVAGTPIIAGHVIVMNPRPVDSFSDTMRTYLEDPQHPGANPGIPATSRHVRLTFVSFDRFTQIAPPAAPRPSSSGNPMIGPDPTVPRPAPLPVSLDCPPVTAVMHGQQAFGTWLLDTGAAASMISTKQAAALGITYTQGTEGTDTPKLAGVPANQQFSLTVGGVGGQKKSAGFFLDSLTLPTVEGDPIVYRHAPVLVNDITVEDAATHQQLTLDGVLGVNLFVASAAVSESTIMPDVSKMTAGPYQWVVIDFPHGTLGLELKK